MNLVFKKVKYKYVHIEDDFFGKLSFVEESKHEPSHFFGAKLFRPVNYKIEYQIYNVSEAVSEDQRKFGVEIETKYPELKDEIENFINLEVKKIDAKGKRYNLEKDLELQLITIPKSIIPTTEWSIEYAVKKDFAFFEIAFHNWKPFWFSISA
jgi:hypothetical protein